MRSQFIACLLAVTLAGSAGCHRNEVVTEVDPSTPTILVVDNQAFNDMAIYVLEGGRRVRLGLAIGNSQTKFTLPKYLVRALTSLRFMADPIGGSRTPVSDEITVSPGEEIALRIPPS